MSTRVTLQPIFVLHTKPFRDTSLLVDLLTLNHGRIHVIARSARGTRSRFKGFLQPFIPFLASWSGSTDLMYLNSLEPNGAPYSLSGTGLISGFYLNELLIKLLYRYDAHPNIYRAYQDALHGLQQINNLERVLRVFEKRLLADLGYGMQLNMEANGVLINEKYCYRYDSEFGFTRCLESKNPSMMFLGKNLLALHQENLQDVEDLRAAKRLMRLMLAPLLENKPIKSRELLNIEV